jgi:hypothetical protein
MTPEEIKTATLDELQKAVTTMMSPEWNLALKKNPESIQTDPDEALLAAQERRLALENAKLEKIAQKLIENEKGLLDGRKNLDEALADLKNVQKVLDMTTDFIKIVDRILEVAAHASSSGL